jgi:hypothetical protein
MTTDEFKSFVRINEAWFRGRLPETEASLSQYEQVLGVRLPESLRWVLKEYGYWHATAISNLEDSVKDTIAARQHLKSPFRFVVLENFQDGGFILIDTSEETSPGESPFYWVSMEDLGASPRLAGNDKYSSYGEYVRDRLPSVQQFIKPEDVLYDPALYAQ